MWHIILLAAGCVTPAFGQSVSKPLEGVSNAEVAAAVASGTTIPMWGYSTTSSRDGQSYSGMMVGASPFSDPNSTTIIPTQIVPLIIHMPDGGILWSDGAQFLRFLPGPNRVPGITLFLDHSHTINGISVGTTQFLDAFQRANFWGLVGGQSYHVLFSATTLSPITVNMPVGSGYTTNGFQSTGNLCGRWGTVVDRETLDQIVRNTLLPQLGAQGVSPTTFPIFLVSNIQFLNSPASYHGAFGSPPQTYAVVSYDTSRINDDSGISSLNFGPLTAQTNTFTGALALADWLNDPLGRNVSPAWGGVGSSAACQANFGVGDRRVPNTDVIALGIVMPDGYTYRVPELPFFSWFFGAPSLGAAGLFSTNISLRGDARPCPPGGSHPTTLGDADGNGKADLVLSNSQTGAVSLLAFSELGLPSHTFFASGVPLVWQIAGRGDVDSDGRADLVWRHGGTGDVAVWLMDGHKIKQAPVVGSRVPLAWQIVKVHDVDGDGKADLVWRHAEAGSVAVWLLDGPTVRVSRVVAGSTPLELRVR